MAKTVYSIDDVPLSADEIQDYYERWRYPEIEDADEDSPGPIIIIDEAGETHYGFITENPALRHRTTQTEYTLANFHHSIDLFRELYSEIVAAVPNDSTKKEKIVYCRLIFGDDRSGPSNSLFRLGTPIRKEYALQFHYNRETQQVHQREQVPRALRDEIIADHDGCVRCQEDADLEIHHIIPYSVCGATEKHNLAPLCRPCHGDAHDAYSDPLAGYDSVEEFWKWVVN